MLDGPSFPVVWPRRPIYELARWTNGLAFRDFQFAKLGWPIIKIAELKDGITGQTRFTQQTFDERYHVKKGDMLFSWSGNPDTSIDVFWWRQSDGWLNQHIFKVEPTDVDTVFFYYLLKYLRPTFGEIARNKQTTGLGHVTAADLKSLLVGVPSLRTQRVIARVLGALDDKIDLNLRMNHNIEQIAGTLFKSWFVRFDPVRAKAEGKEVGGMDAETTALFPDSFEQSENGEVPKGWEVVSLLDFATLLSGGTPATSDPSYWDGGIPWASGKDVAGAAGGYLLETERTISQAGVENSATQLLPEGTVIITARGTVGALAVLSRPMCMSQTSYGLKARDGVGDNFLRFTIANAVSDLRQQSYGTIFDTITTKNLRQTRVLMPSRPVMDAYCARIDPLMRLTLSNLRESRILAQIRDTLLPRLLSGEIRLR